METPFPNVMNQPVPPDRTELGPPPPMVIQQYARYPPAVEPGLHSASSIGSARSRIATSKSPPLHRKATPRSLQASPTGPRPVVPPAPVARPGPSMSPPVYDPLRQRPPRESIDQTDTRALPSRDLTDSTIDDAYIMFIFYCNPNVPLAVDTSELRKTFRCPPRSDGKSFSVFALWELIKKLDSKELKTWIQLAIELGVEPPSMEKKQSTQKVQQYAVRLKRWMRAMHVDAFFEYCLGHHHPYYTLLPPHNVISDSRDGVPLEEDLALRALVPQWKPKRGRRRTDDPNMVGEHSAKRPQLDTSVGILPAGPYPGQPPPFPSSAIPFSAFSEEIESHDPWMGTAPAYSQEGSSEVQAPQPGQDMRWRPIEQRDASPAGIPHSAIIPRIQHQSEIFIQPAEPRSALTPTSGEKPRPKRRHGPAVSSAWPSNNGSNGKTRGRPPNRGMVSGPFSSFPVNPNRPDPSQLHSSGMRPSPATILEQDPSNRFSHSQYQQSPTPFPFGPRPNKLQLQVPQHPGAPVRLATPPTLMVNGINNASTSLKVEGSQRNGTLAPLNDFVANVGVTNPSSYANRTSVPHMDITFDDVVRVLSGELLRGKLTGRPAPLSAEEARSLAVSVMSNLTTTYAKLPAGLAALMSAFHLGLGQQFGYPGVTDSLMTVSVDAVPAVTSDMPSVDASANFVYTISHEYKHGRRFSTKVTYGDLSVSKTDSNKLEITPRATEELDTSVAEVDSLTDAEFEMDGAESTMSETTWKQRYLKLRSQMQRKERSLSQYKRKILESVMADI
ncbi:putative ARS binding protein Abp2 [Aspergillus heteromorphus CBS 117.55]|uniref:Putative ARS binding protein Abp2 n=1 Tax=Aspergillus heteromorphus CBS 117.55 TaxID=1448321 RepID=A0A317WKA0_9EURO|nr:putative ARS binding protein Abp2 [Aspergillus heteromorphus CBS 117.55]PWY86896.1 putative ARS binding protein Abp2 [Aspergillus heteromorphus CBS 117.55]